MHSVHKSHPLPSDSHLETRGQREELATAPRSTKSRNSRGGWACENSDGPLCRGGLAGVCKVPPAKRSFQQTVTAGLCPASAKYRRSPYEGPIVWSQWLFLASGILLCQGVICSGHWGGYALRALPNIGLGPALQEKFQWLKWNLTCVNAKYVP